MNLSLGACALFADKAYACTATKAEFDNTGTAFATPTKKEKNQPLEQSDCLWSRFVSSMRQPIESLFNWIIEQTGIQNTSKVRSTNGLLVHCYGVAPRKYDKIEKAKETADSQLPIAP